MNVHDTYVLASDYDALKADNERLRAALTDAYGADPTDRMGIIKAALAVKP
jgi:hypothetical protein